MIERVLQLRVGSGSHIYYGASIQTKTNPNTFYYNVKMRQVQLSGGWTKDNWLGLCNNFRLEFVYG